MNRDEDLQAPIPSDHNVRRRAWWIIGGFYGGALFADELLGNWPLIVSWFQ